MMLMIILIFAGLVFLVLTPSFLSPKKQAIAEAIQSFKVREKNLKSDYQFRIKELKRRHQSGYYDDEDFQSMVNELDQEFSQSLLRLSSSQTEVTTRPGRKSLLLVFVLSVGVAVTIYLKIGALDFVDEQQQLTSLLQQNSVAMNYLKQQASHENNMENVKQLILASRMRLDLTPYNPDVWMDYGQIQSRLGRYQNAVEAMEKAMQLAPDNNDIKLALAQVLPRLDSEFAKKEADILIQQVLKADPENEKALLAIGFNAYSNGNYALAITSWEKVIAKRPPDSKAVKLLKRSIETAKVKMHQLSSKPSLAKTQTQKAVAATKGKVTVNLAISETLLKQLKGTEQVFVFAKAVNGPPMPLAVKRIPVSALPQKLTLSDDNAMRPELRMSQFTNIYISAKLSRTGNVLDKSGDIVVKSQPVSAPYKDQVITLKLDKSDS